MEDTAVRPAEKPCVVVGTERFVVGFDVVTLGVAEYLPGLLPRIVDLAVLGVFVSSAPRTANGEDAFIREGDDGIVSTAELHAPSTLPASAIGNAGFVRVGTAGHDDSAVEVHGNAGAEHVVIVVGTIGLDNFLLDRIPCRRESCATEGSKELNVRPGRPKDGILVVIMVHCCVGTCYGNNEQTESTDRWVDRSSVPGSVDGGVDDAGPCFVVLGVGRFSGRRFTPSNELHALGNLRFEDSEFHALIPPPRVNM